MRVEFLNGGTIRVQKNEYFSIPFISFLLVIDDEDAANKIKEGGYNVKKSPTDNITYTCPIKFPKASTGFYGPPSEKKILSMIGEHVAFKCDYLQTDLFAHEVNGQELPSVAHVTRICGIEPL